MHYREECFQGKTLFVTGLVMKTAPETKHSMFFFFLWDAFHPNSFLRINSSSLAMKFILIMSRKTICFSNLITITLFLDLFVLSLQSDRCRYALLEPNSSQEDYARLYLSQTCNLFQPLQVIVSCFPSNSRQILGNWQRPYGLAVVTSFRLFSNNNSFKSWR